MRLPRLSGHPANEFQGAEFTVASSAEPARDEQASIMCFVVSYVLRSRLGRGENSIVAELEKNIVLLSDSEKIYMEEV